LLNPKPPDPEAAFVFPAQLFPAEIPEKPARRSRGFLTRRPIMSRSTEMLTRAAAAAFDFDVVTDVAPRPSRKPDPVPETPAPNQGVALEPAKPAEG
jgi:hypothetical protein